MNMTRYEVEGDADKFEQVYKAAEVEAIVWRLVPYLDHHLTCRYHKTDTPAGDVCACDYGALKSDIQRLLTEIKETAP